MARPVAGSATADTSAMARPLQLVIAEVCPAGAALRVVQPEPAPFQAVSAQPRAVLFFTSEVPPTAVT